jgi:hypothetical protein
MSWKARQKSDLYLGILHLINLGSKQILKMQTPFRMDYLRRISRNKNIWRYVRKYSRIIERLRWCWARLKIVFNRPEWKYKSRLSRLKILLITIKEHCRKCNRILNKKYKKNSKRTFYIRSRITIALMKLMRQIKN